MGNKASLHAVVSGHVQGVFFRAFVAQQASKLGLVGFVRNLPNGFEVEVQAEGDKEQLEGLVEYLKTGPPGARVENVVSDCGEFKGRFTAFKIMY